MKLGSLLRRAAPHIYLLRFERGALVINSRLVAIVTLMVGPVVDPVWANSSVDPDRWLPELRLHVEPHYPPQAWVDCVEGEVILEFTVDQTGGVDALRVLKSEPPGIFDESAKEAVRQWKFAPIPEGLAQWPTLRQTIEFRLPERDHDWCALEEKPVDLQDAPPPCDQEIMRSGIFLLTLIGSRVPNVPDKLYRYALTLEEGAKTGRDSCDIVQDVRKILNE